MSKSFKISECGTDISDGYHTFDELYDHRNLLWINYCLTHRKCSFWVRDHYDGWDLLVMESPEGQISYHVAESNRHFYERILNEVQKENYTFDGHTPEQVVTRLCRLAASHISTPGSVIA